METINSKLIIKEGEGIIVEKDDVVTFKLWDKNNNMTQEMVRLSIPPDDIYLTNAIMSMKKGEKSKYQKYENEELQEVSIEIIDIQSSDLFIKRLMNEIKKPLDQINIEEMETLIENSFHCINFNSEADKELLQKLYNKTSNICCSINSYVKALKYAENSLNIKKNNDAEKFKLESLVNLDRTNEAIQYIKQKGLKYSKAYLSGLRKVNISDSNQSYELNVIYNS